MTEKVSIQCTKRNNSWTVVKMPEPLVTDCGTNTFWFCTLCLLCAICLVCGDKADMVPAHMGLMIYCTETSDWLGVLMLMSPTRGWSRVEWWESGAHGLLGSPQQGGDIWVEAEWPEEARGRRRRETWKDSEKSVWAGERLDWQLAATAPPLLHVRLQPGPWIPMNHAYPWGPWTSTEPPSPRMVCAQVLASEFCF